MKMQKDVGTQWLAEVNRERPVLESLVLGVSSGLWGQDAGLQTRESGAPESRRPWKGKAEYPPCSPP